MIPLKILKVHHVSVDEFNKLSDIKQIKLKMQYDFVKEQTNVGYSLFSVFNPFFLMLGFVFLCGLITYQYDLMLSASFMSLFISIISILYYFVLAYVVLKIVYVYVYVKKYKQAMTILFDKYFTKFSRRAKK
jgi:hypothetical protein